ncbi:hypothetical protein [Aureibacter tunicatorum]|uniref:Uncharacterized protein n=1 Tax=Aureibacter tunicatorum TaxID=866807 RepID=A0AAE3XM70_9BACT|nr:hypothetical protein [Aureibacter tunicatorum]MDR6240471.1 hypothetical protein [Aureibacter tunicatorum]BDD05650.1 hypothetical protein AUTU_31330 [Aureibacter tunicatorum]
MFIGMLMVTWSCKARKQNRRSEQMRLDSLYQHMESKDRLLYDQLSEARTGAFVDEQNKEALKGSAERQLKDLAEKKSFRNWADQNQEHSMEAMRKQNMDYFDPAYMEKLRDEGLDEELLPDLEVMNGLDEEAIREIARQELKQVDSTGYLGQAESLKNMDASSLKSIAENEGFKRIKGLDSLAYIEKLGELKSYDQQDLENLSAYKMKEALKEEGNNLSLDQYDEYSKRYAQERNHNEFLMPFHLDQNNGDSLRLAENVELERDSSNVVDSTYDELDDSDVIDTLEIKAYEKHKLAYERKLKAYKAGLVSNIQGVDLKKKYTRKVEDVKKKLKGSQNKKVYFPEMNEESGDLRKSLNSKMTQDSLLMDSLALKNLKAVDNSNAGAEELTFDKPEVKILTDSLTYEQYAAKRDSINQHLSDSIMSVYMIYDKGLAYYQKAESLGKLDENVIRKEVQQISKVKAKRLKNKAENQAKVKEKKYGDYKDIIVKDKEKRLMPENLYFDGTFGISSEKPFSMNVSPAFGYEVNDKLSIGLGTGFEFTADTSVSVQMAMPLKVFARYFFWEDVVYAYGENSMYVPGISYLKTAEQAEKKPNDMGMVYSLGLGGLLSVSDRLKANVLLLYNPVQSVDTPFGRSKWSLRFGFKL